MEQPHVAYATATGPDWVRSSYSGNSGNCVEVAALPEGGRLLRDSKDPHGPRLAVTNGQFTAFVRHATRGA
ncbi:DUF397 domain-containing protein [Streptomyces sp. NPDC054784]